MNTDTIATLLREQAESDNSEYPQYQGYWDSPDWQVITIARRVRTRMGVAFEQGEKALARLGEDGFWTAYSHRNRINTSLRSKDVLGG